MDALRLAERLLVLGYCGKRSDRPAEGEQGLAKADEARSGLKELGLDDNVELE